jgi:predicted phosphohydrolase
MSRGANIRRLAWATDIHLNFLRGDPGPFCEQLASAAPDGLVITGDISEADTLDGDLALLDSRLWCPTWLVLGNHDFYNGSIRQVRKAVAALCRRSRWLHYLPDADVVTLAANTALVGHDGWADGRLGDYAGSDVMLNDYLMIEELAGLDAQARLARMNALGDEAAAHFRHCLPAALQRHRRIIVATHVPPFREACWHDGRITGDNFLPHFTCAAVGETLTTFMRRFPDHKTLVLCGHTHSPGTARILPNLLVRTGGAAYGRPGVVDVIDTGSVGADRSPAGS